MLQLLAKDLSFIPQVYIVEDGFYGSKVNGTWNGMIGDLNRGKADLAAAQLTVTKARSNVVEFVQPYTEVKQGIMMLNNKETKELAFHFFSFMETDLSWTFLGFAIIGLCVVYIIEYISMRYQGRLEEEASNTRPLWMETFTYISGITFQRDLGGRNPKGTGARLTSVVVAFGMVVTMTAYTAVLTATTVKQEETDPFNGINDERVMFIIFKFPY